MKYGYIITCIIKWKVTLGSDVLYLGVWILNTNIWVLIFIGNKILGYGYIGQIVHPKGISTLNTCLYSHFTPLNT
jgi:hypothetical protein